MTPPPTPREVMAAVRSETVADAAHAATVARSKGSRRTRDGHRLVMTSEPELIVSEAGATIGVEVRVRLYGPDGEEVRIDPHRRFLNPPTEVATPEGEPNDQDPVAALWSILWDSVDVAPNPDDWEP